MRSTLRRFLLWYLLLTKRLLKKPAYLALLLAVPLLAGAMSLSAREDAGLITVAVAGGENDPAAQAARQRLLHRRGALRYREFDTPEQARDAVAGGQADAAWIFLPDAAEQIERFAASDAVRGAVLVVEREDNVFLHLAREELLAALYPEASRALFRQYLGGLDQEKTPLSREEAARWYRAAGDRGNVVAFAYVDGREQEPPADFLVNPLRGLLSLLTVFAALASCMYYYADEDAETFLRLRGPRVRVLPLLCHFCAAAPVAAAGLAALGAAGMLRSLPLELGLSALLCLSAAGFCEVLRRVLRRREWLGAMLPILMMGMLVLCPIFLHFKRMAPLRMLLPPVYYLNDAYRGGLDWAFPLYAAAAMALAVLLPPPSETPRLFSRGGR